MSRERQHTVHIRDASEGCMIILFAFICSFLFALIRFLS
jgi:hypothetical protein